MIAKYVEKLLGGLAPVGTSGGGAISWLLDAQVQVAGSPVLVREIVGNVFGLVLGAARPAPGGLGLAGRHDRQLAAVHRLPRRRLRHPAGARPATARPAGRSSSSPSASTAGGAGRATATPAPAASRRGRAALGHLPGTARPARRRRRRHRRAYPVLAALGSWCPLPDAWILIGSLLATYGMARGWVEFWLIWIAVDAVGVPLLLRGGFYPSAAMYLVYGAFCAWGFVPGGAPRGSPARRPPRSRRPTRRPWHEHACGHLWHHRAGGRGHRRRPAGRRRRRRGPGERGRPDLRGRAGHAGAARVHGPLHLRLHLRAADRGATPTGSTCRRCTTPTRTGAAPRTR